MLRSASFLMALSLIFIFGAGVVRSKEGRSGQTGVFKEIFAAPLTEDQAAFVFLGYSAVIVRTAKGAVIIDPAELLFEEDMEAFKTQKVDAVLYTHSHGDHFNRDTAVRIYEATHASICAGGDIVGALKRSGKIPADRIVEMSPGQPQTVGAWTVTPVKGSHIGPIVLYHLAAGGIAVFHGGDSAYVSLKNLSAGLAFLPAGEPSPTASPDAAFKMAQDLKPRTVVAFHGLDDQYRELTNKIKAAFPTTEVIIPETMKVYTVKAR